LRTAQKREIKKLNEEPGRLYKKGSKWLSSNGWREAVELEETICIQMKRRKVTQLCNKPIPRGYEAS